MTGWEELGYLPRSLRESPQKSGSRREGAGVGRLHAGTSLEGTEATVYPTVWLHPQTGWSPGQCWVCHHQPGLALPWQPSACRAGVGTTHRVPAPKGQVSPAWKWCPRCCPSSPISGDLACQALLGQGCDSKVTKEWRADDKGRAGRWRELPRAGRSPLK